MRSDVSIAVLVASTILLAGCTAQGNAATPQDASAAPPSSAAGEGAATIRAVVTDDTLVPLPGVTVALKESSALATTDEGGQALFTQVDPGEYTLIAQRLGYEAAAKKVRVIADETVDVQFQLVAIPVVEARHFTYIFKGYMTCGGGLIVVAFTFCGNYTQPSPAGNITFPALDPNHRVFFDQQGTPEHKTIIAEMVWKPGSAVSARSMQLHLWQNHRCTPVCNPEHRYGSGEGPSPVVVRSDGPFAGLKKGPATITHTVWTPFQTSDPPYIVLTIQQPFTLYSTHFFGQEAPEDFVARPDG